MKVTSINKNSIVSVFFALFMLLGTITTYAQAPATVFVKGGEFIMGADDGDDDEKPLHSVKVNDFYIGKYEVTVAEYRLFTIGTSRRMPDAPAWGLNDKHPITNISWEDAVAYCKWLSLVTGKDYRLPTEAEWEFAAHGGTKSKNYKYSGSNNFKDVAWCDETSKMQGTQEVGKKKPNELGIYDMSGNVWEWCADEYKNYAGNPKQASQGVNSQKIQVIRGGGWHYDAFYSRIPSRDGPEHNFTNDTYGFRVALSK